MKFSELELLGRYELKSTHPVLVDVGAHHGRVSRFFAEKGWRVVAFEPENRNREAFERNLADFPQVDCINKAVSDVTGDTVPFYVSAEHYGIHCLKPFHSTHRFAYDVETARLDDALEEMQVPEVTFLKIDIEGADFLALKGFDFEKYHPELVMIEFMDDRSMPNFGYTHDDIVTYMEGKGYSALVSEWEAIREYAREGIPGNRHVWVQCSPWPLDHKPAWGNLIFVPNNDKEKLTRTVKLYLRHLKRVQRANWIRNVIRKIPGSRFSFYLLKKLFA